MWLQRLFFWFVGCLLLFPETSLQSAILVVYAAEMLQRREREIAGKAFFTTWITGVEDVFHHVPLEGPPCFHCFLDAKLAPGYLAWMVNDGEEVHLGVGGYAAHFDPLRALEQFRASLLTIVKLDQATHIERRGGRIPVGGILRHIANEQGLLVGGAAGAVSPLTAGGLDPCLRLSILSARVIAEYLATENIQSLTAYNGSVFRAHFRGRLWMRTLLAGMRNQSIIEAACAMLRLPLFRSVARHTFFGRGSFPDISLTKSLTEGSLLDSADTIAHGSVKCMNHFGPPG